MTNGCYDADQYLVIKHWSSDRWHVDMTCGNPDHWIPNCQVAHPKENTVESAQELADELNQLIYQDMHCPKCGSNDIRINIAMGRFPERKWCESCKYEYPNKGQDKGVK